MKDGVEQNVIIFCPKCTQKINIAFFQKALTLYVSAINESNKNEDLR